MESIMHCVAVHLLNMCRSSSFGSRKWHQPEFEANQLSYLRTSHCRPADLAAEMDLIRAVRCKRSWILQVRHLQFSLLDGACGISL